MFWSSWSFIGLSNLCFKYDTAGFINGIEKLCQCACKHAYINTLMHTHNIQTALTHLKSTFKPYENTTNSFLSPLLARLRHIFEDSLPMTLLKWVPLMHMLNLSQELCLLTIQAPFIHQGCALFHLLFISYFDNDLKHNISHYMKAITILYTIRERRRKRGGKRWAISLGLLIKGLY